MGAMHLGSGPAALPARATPTPTATSPVHTPAAEPPTSGAATPTAAAAAAAASSPILSAHLPLVPAAAPALPAHLTALVGRRLPAGSAPAPLVAPPPLVLAPPRLAPSPLAASSSPQASPLVTGPLVTAPLVAAPLAGPLAALVNAAPAPPAGGDGDAPLASRRRAPPLGVTAATAPLVSAGAATPLITHPPSPSPLPAATAAPAPFPALALPPALLPVPPAPPAAVPGVLFAAVFLTPASREVLLCLVPPCHPLHRADHMTLAFRPALDQLLALPLGAAVALRITGQCCDARAQVCAADPPPWLPPTTSAATHVTLSLAPGVPAREAGLLLSRVMERVAAGAAPNQGAEGSYEHFPDPLELAGFVGIEMEDGSRLFSLQEVAAPCGVALTATQVERYEATHGARLREAGGPVPAGMRKAPYGSTAERNAPAAASTAAPVPLVAARLAPAAQPSAALAPAGGAAPPAASPPASPGGGLGDFWGAIEAARSPTSPAVSPPAAPAAAPLSPLQLPAAAALRTSSRRSSVDGAGPGSGAGCSAPSTPGSSASGDAGPVVYRSAVRVGDWALVAPLEAEEATDGAGRRVVVMREGWVKDVLLDDAYQELGVLVLLHDNTIGRVQSVCDPQAAQLEHLLSSDRGDSPAPGAAGASPAASGSGRRGHEAAPEPPPARRPSPQRLVLVPLPGSPAAGGRAAPSTAAGAPLVPGQRKPAGAGNHASEEQQLLRLLSGASSANLAAATAAAGGRAVAAAAAAARDDLALWREFEQLREQFGQAACDAALEDCGCDFAAAIEAIRGRAATGKLTAQPRGGAGAAAVADGWASPDSRGSGRGGPSTPVRAVAAGDGSPGHVRTVAALADAFGVPEAAALRLCASLPHVPPAAAVKALAAAGGDANAAAAALLLAEHPSPAKAAGAAAAQAQAQWQGSPPRSPRPARDPQQAALRALCGPDPADVVSLRRLAEVFPSVPRGLAAEVLKQAGGSYEAAARTLADGLAAEARGARAPAYEAPSEADQLAMLRAMGILSEEAAAPAAAAAAVGSPASPARDAGLADPNGWTCPSGGAGWGPRPMRRSRGGGGGGEHHYPSSHHYQTGAAAAASPPRATLLAVPRAPEPLVSEEELAAMTREEFEAKIAELRARADVHFQAGRIFMHAAQQAVLEKGPCAEYEAQLRRSKDEASAGKRVMAEVDRLALRLSNQDKRNLWTIDLHGASARAAAEEVARVVGQIRAIAGSGGVTVRVVTGKGKHSKDGVPVVKAAVLRHLEETGQQHELEPGNEGVVWIHVSQGEGGGSGRLVN